MLGPARILGGAMPRPFPFDAVLFDLDGTLVATDGFWIEAAGEGCRRAFDELGLDRPLPSAEQWMSMVGLPLDEGFGAVFADLDPAQRQVVLTRCEEAEHEALARGGARLLPGALETLEELRRRDVRVGIASNCAQPYLDAMMRDLPLGELVDDARCLDTPGVVNKADMLRGLLEAFGTRSAVMVGDRAGDAAAAHANGLPHVHLTGGFATAGEQVVCEAELAGLPELLARLEVRSAWIEAALERLGCFRTPPIRSLGITGRRGAGKTLFARDAARLVAARAPIRLAGQLGLPGRGVSVVALDDYLLPRGGGASLAPEVDRLPGGAELASWARESFAWDLDRLFDELLEPHAAGAPARGPRGVPVPADSLLVLEGRFLLHPRVRLMLDRVLYLEAPEAVCLARLAGRGDSAEALQRARELDFPAQLAADAELDPETRADLVLPAGNALGPEPLRA